MGFQGSWGFQEKMVRKELWEPPGQMESKERREREDQLDYLGMCIKRKD